MKKHIKVLKQEPGVTRLFQLMKEKYRSLGRVGGSVSIAQFTTEEIEAIASLMGQSPHDLQEKGKILLLQFEKALQETIFSTYTFLELLEEVLGEKVVSKKVEKELKEEERAYFLQQLQEQLPYLNWWWDWINQNRSDCRWIWGLYEKDQATLFEYFTTIHHAFLHVPKGQQYEKLPLFAQRVTGNPHAFDQNTNVGKLLIHCLTVDQIVNQNREKSTIQSTEDLNDLLGFYHLMRDDLWSFVTCRGFYADGITGEHALFTAAVQTNSVLNVPLKLLNELTKIRPSKGNKVWIVENSSVCSSLIDEVPNAPIICTHGQFRIASWLFLDKLVDENTIIYYSGDMDPEGVLMAERIKQRFEEHVVIWRMSVDDYRHALSDEDISTRISQLENIQTIELHAVIEELQIKQKASYQEGLIEWMIEDIKKGMEHIG